MTTNWLTDLIAGLGIFTVCIALAILCWYIIVPMALVSWGLFNANVSDVRRMSDPVYRRDGIDWDRL